MEPTIKKLKFLIRDEKEAAKLYRRYGFKGLARDESRHRRFLLKKLKHETKERR